MRTKQFSRAGRLGAAVGLMALLTGCWSQVGFDAGHSNASPFPTPIGPANVGTVQSVFSTTGAASGDNADTVESAGTLFVGGAR
ncbi:MAG: hypothetical protein ABJC79_08625, partial [Acidimicrobiia bacterium]